MRLAILGGNNATLPEGWTSESGFSFLGGLTFDARGVAPGPGATIKAYTFLGGVDIKVPPGTRVTSGGFSLFGGADVRVKPGDGPEINVRAFALFGGVNVSDESG
jgi:hypothetical protein